MDKQYIVANAIITITLLCHVATANHPQRLQLDTSSNGRPQLMVAIQCGASDAAPTYFNQYLDIETRRWRTDRSSSAFCTRDREEILNYCRKVYPQHDIRNFVESSRPYSIDHWCKIGSKRRCPTRLSVKPFRCLEGTFQSDALLVPEHCVFDHAHNKSICESSDYWNKTAVQDCLPKKMKLQSYAMLQPCGLGQFSGVEFVCCPSSGSTQQVTSDPSSSSKIETQSKDSNSFAQASSWSTKAETTKYEQPDERLNSIKTDDENKKNHEQNASNESDESDSDSDGEDDEDDDEYDDDEDEYDDDSSSWKGDRSQSGAARASSTTSTSTTTTTTTTTTERPIDHYLSHFDLTHEHDEFRKAELAVEANYRDKITHVMHEWGQLDNRYEEMKKRDPQAAEDFKKRMAHEFQKTINALEEEGAAQRHQLASMHAERAMAIINRRKKAAMDCLTQALDLVPARTRQVERCIVKLLKALEKDRSHTLRQYKNLLNLNTREALREKKIILDHLVTLSRAANQSIAMLDRSPVLVEKLKTKIVALWHKLRNIPLDEPIVRESELKIMEKYEEEVAQRKIEKEHQRLIEQGAVQDSPQESVSPVQANTGIGYTASTEKPDSESNLDGSKLSSTNSNSNDGHIGSSTEPKLDSAQNTSPPPTPQTQHLNSQTFNKQEAPRSDSNRQHSSPRTGEESENEIHYSMDSAQFSHLKADPSSYHELSYSVKHEPAGTSRMELGYSTLLVSSCMIVIVLAMVGLKYYSRNSTRAYKRQGFAEVGRSCPDEKSVTSMQFTGYENPAYKFFEAEA